LDLTRELIAIAGSDTSWETKYDVIFSGAGFGRLVDILSKINLKTGFHSFDEGYQEEVRGVKDALERLEKELSELHRSFLVVSEEDQ
jgi:hypothetical protein